MRYLYHCAGCKKDDKEYPDEEIECEECLGEDVGAYVDDNGDCWKCGGYGTYTLYCRPIAHHMWARNDAYGIYTGLYCDKCYKSNYPYRKDRYHDESYCGERLEPNE
jgi:hypothetical protein